MRLVRWALGPAHIHDRIVRMHGRVAVLSFVVFLACLACDSLFANDATRSSSRRDIPRTSAAKLRLSQQPILPGSPDGPSLPLAPGMKTAPQPKQQTAKPEDIAPALGTGQYKDMILIPAGAFVMGSPKGRGRTDEQPAREVHVKDFYISIHEVTATEYSNFLNDQGLKRKDGVPRIDLTKPWSPIAWNGKAFAPKEGMPDHPVVSVSWYGAADYAKWAGGRLPTAAEWEKAAFVTTPSTGGDFLTHLSRESSVPVQIAFPGRLGIRGMMGNVWEWCSDWYERDYYSRGPSSNPMGPPLGKEKEIRGGSWASSEASKRVLNRHKAPPEGFFRTVGFRIVKD